MYPFYIPSIYRSNSSFLLKLRDMKPIIKYYIIIAEDQLDDYLKNFPKENLIILPTNKIKRKLNIAEIRQYILDVARKNKETKIWMSDDDLSKFYIKNTSNTLEASLGVKEVDFKTFITKAEETIKKFLKENKENKENIVQFGFKYSTFAIPKKPITINTNIGMIQLLDIEKTKNINYDTSFITLEDTDYTIQLLQNNFKNLQLNHFIFTAPKSGTGKGGLETQYLEGAKQKGIKLFKSKYTDLMNITDLEKGKYKINWKKFQDLETENTFYHKKN